jgi:hypothetical protein
MRPQVWKPPPTSHATQGRGCRAAPAETAGDVAAASVDNPNPAAPRPTFPSKLLLLDLVHDLEAARGAGAPVCQSGPSPVPQRDGTTANAGAGQTRTRAAAAVGGIAAPYAARLAAGPRGAAEAGRASPRRARAHT